MSNQPIPLEANLVFFLHDRLEPALQKAQAVTAPRNLDAIYSNLELIETFLWLHLGVRIGYLPQPLSRRVIYEYSVPIFKAYGVISDSRQIETWFAPPMRSILEEEFSGRSPLLNLPERPGMSRLLELWRSFQDAFAIANELAQNLEVRRLIAAISLVPDSKWQQTLSRIQSGLSSMPLEEEGLAWSPESFFRVIEYMQDVRQLHQNAVARLEYLAKTTPNVTTELVDRDRDALERFFDQVKQVQQWKFNFGYPVPRERILEAARYLAEYLLKLKTVSFSDPQDDIRRLQKEVSDLLQFWGAPHSLSAGA